MDVGVAEDPKLSALPQAGGFALPRPFLSFNFRVPARWEAAGNPQHCSRGSVVLLYEPGAVTLSEDGVGGPPGVQMQEGGYCVGLVARERKSRWAVLTVFPTESLERTGGAPLHWRGRLLDCNVSLAQRVAAAIERPIAHSPPLWATHIAGPPRPAAPPEGAGAGASPDGDADREPRGWSRERLLRRLRAGGQLNESQLDVVLGALLPWSGVRLVQGPPGCGKTQTLAVLLDTLLGLRRRALVCAPTNVAVAELAERLVRRQLVRPPDAVCAGEEAEEMEEAEEAHAEAAEAAASAAVEGLARIALVADGDRVGIRWGDERSRVFLEHRKKRIRRVARFWLGESVGHPRPFLEQPPWAEPGEDPLTSLLRDPHGTWRKWRAWARALDQGPPDPGGGAPSFGRLSSAWAKLEGASEEGLGRFMSSALRALELLADRQLAQMRADLPAAPALPKAGGSVTSRPTPQEEERVYGDLLRLRASLAKMWEALVRLRAEVPRHEEEMRAWPEALPRVEVDRWAPMLGTTMGTTMGTTRSSRGARTIMAVIAASLGSAEDQHLWKRDISIFSNFDL